MSDTSSNASSDSEDLTTTGLIATRAKRSTAGNLYAGLRANLDDEELQKELLAEDAEDVGDYEGSDKEGEDDDEAAFESESEDEDQGPPKEGENEDLEGEKALKKHERAEAKRKRGAKDARLKIPRGLGMARQRKRVRLAEGVKCGDDDGESGSVAPKPKKKSERSNWLPTAEDGPVRQSGRALAVANRQTVHANLKQSAARSEKQRKVMRDAAERERSKRSKHADLTQEERLKRCEKVEKETEKELGRFEEQEREKERIREEQLAKRRKRGVGEGPVMRMWSGSCVWEGERVRVDRVEHGSLGEKGLERVGIIDLGDDAEAGAGAQMATGGTGESMSGVESTSAQVLQQQPTETSAAAAPVCQDSTPDAPVSWLQGIEQYAAQPAATPNPPASAGLPINGFTPSAPAATAYSVPNPYAAPAVQPPQPPQPQIYHGWPPGPAPYGTPQQTLIPGPSHTPTTPAPPPPPPQPLIREQALRTLLILNDFPDLATPDPPTTATGRPSKRKSLTTTAKTSSTTNSEDTLLQSDPLKSHLLGPDAYPPFTPDQKAYLTTKSRKKGLEQTLPPAPPKTRCAVTSWQAKFRDPKTGVPYADLHAYKAVQRCLSGGTVWSGILGASAGARSVVGEGGKVGIAGGRAARGVPGGFSEGVGGGGDGGVKVEGGA